MFFFLRINEKFIYLTENPPFGPKSVLSGHYLKDVEWNYTLSDDDCVVIPILKHIIREQMITFPLSIFMLNLNSFLGTNNWPNHHSLNK